MASAPVRRIEGRHHPLVKAVRRMVRSGELLADGQVLLETPRLVEDAMASGIALSHVLLSTGALPRFRGLRNRLPAPTAVYELPPALMATLTSTATDQGIVALASAPRWSEQDLFATAPPLLLILAGLQDPGNLGTILRTAEAFGATGILLTKGSVSPYNAKAIRASAGSLFRLPILRDLSAREALEIIKRHEVPLVAAAVKGGKSLSDGNWTGPLAVAIGSEGAGLPRQMAEAAEPITISIAPAVQSLNAAAATGVILYEIARQRR